MKSGLQIDKEIYKSQCKAYYHHLAKVQKEYYQSKVESCDQCKLFQVVKKLTSPSTDCILPKHICDKTLANNFATFLVNKIKKVREGLSQGHHKSVIPLWTSLKVSAKRKLYYWSNRLLQRHPLWTPCQRHSPRYVVQRYFHWLQK